VFATKYRCKYLVYYETYASIRDAIAREKQVKNWHRAWKISLIRSKNPEMKDLWEDLI
jgi:putative endonuclease